MTKNIDKYDDLIDSRDVIERIEDLEELHEDNLSEEEREELSKLRELAALLDTESEWVHGLTLIRDSYFVEYAEQLAEDLGEVPKQHSWPHYCIDWEWAARELKMDYSCVTWDGVDYWYRS